MKFLTSVCSLLSGLCWAAEPQIEYPVDAAATDDGTVYVADRKLPGIWRIRDQVPAMFFRGSKKFRTPLNAVRCVAIDHQGHLLAGDSSTRDVYRFSEDGKPVPLTSGHIGIPMSIAVAADGTIFVADLELHRIWKMPPTGLEEPIEYAVINSPRGLALDSDGVLWVLSTSSKHGQLQRVAPDGTVTSLIPGHPFRLPHQLVRMEDGSFFVTDNYGRCLWKVSSDGATEKWLRGRPLDRPVGLCRFGDDLLITDPHRRTVFRLQMPKTVTVFAIGVSDPDETDE